MKPPFRSFAFALCFALAGPALAVPQGSAPPVPVGAPGGAAPWAQPGYDVIGIAGQSNACGRAPSDPLIDVAHPRVFQFGGTAASAAYYGAILSGADPLQQPEKVETGIVGPGSAFGRTYADGIAPNRRVLLVPLCWGSTALVGTGAQGSYPGTAPAWAPGNPGGGLYENAVAQANAALAAAQALYPASAYVGTLWVQGEADTLLGVTQSVYASALDALIGGFRSRIAGAATSWFVVGGTVPEWFANAGGAVNLAQVDTPRRDLLTAFVPGPAGHVWAGDGFNIHYDAAGARILGASMALAVPRAQADVLGTPPLPPSSIAATSTPGIQTGVTVTLGPSPGRATDTLVQYAPHGSAAWTTAPHGPASIGAGFAISGLATGTLYDVRAAAINETGTSAYTPPAAAAPLANPGAPTSPTIGTVLPSSVALSATAPTAGGAVASYTLQYALASASAWTTAASGLSGPAGTVMGLTPATAYKFQVLAVNTSGSAASATVTATTAAATTPVDVASAAAQSAFGLRQLRAAYAGPLLRVQRASDGAQRDVGFTANGALDTAALLNFAGAGSAAVATWYDQSGTGADMKQATASAMPLIVSGGALVTNTAGRPALLFNAANAQFLGNNIVPALPQSADDSLSVVMETTASVSGKYSLLGGYTNTQFTLQDRATDAFTVFQSGNYSTPPASAVQNTIAPNAVHALMTSYVEASKTVQATVDNVPVITNGVFPGGQSEAYMAVGGWPGNTGAAFYTSGYISEVIVFKAALSAAQMQNLYNNQKSAFGTS